MPPRHTIPERIRESDIPQDRFTDKCNLLWLDDGIGALRSKLKSLGMDENTVIIYFNDHGNENGGKGSLYQSGIRTIGFAWSTNHFKRENAFTPRVQNIDFAPTILDLADVPEKKWQFMDGKSILPAIQGKTNRVHRSLYFEIGNARAVIMDSLKYYAVRHPSRIKNMPYKKRKKLLETKAKRAERRWIDDWPVHDPSKPFDHLGLVPGGNSYSWKTQEHHPHYFDTDQLYNLNRDPKETVNLYNNEAYQKQAIKMKARLNQYVDDLPGDFGEYGDTSFVK
jgi:arylsulfatase A-like enzyme